jgi:DNA-directed RNA polymerase subunit RPC12/RpoP
MSEEQKVRFLLPAYNPRKCPKCGAIFGLHKHETGYFAGKTICMNCGYRVGMTDFEYEKYRRDLLVAKRKAGMVI